LKLRNQLDTSDLNKDRGGVIIPLFFLFMTVLLPLSSCIKEEFNSDQLNSRIQISPSIATPIGWARYQLDEMLSDSLSENEIKSDLDGFLYLVYPTDTFTFPAGEIVQIGDLPATMTAINSPFGVRTNLDTLPEPFVYFDTIEIPLPISGLSNAEIDSIVFRYGEITVETTAPSYPDLFYQVKVFIEGLGVQATSDEAGNPDPLIFQNKTLVIDNTGPVKNAIKIILTITLQDTVATIDPGPIINMNFSMANVDFSTIYGYLGNFEVNIGPQTLELNFFDQLSGGKFHFEDPQLAIHTANSFGLPVGLDLSGFSATGGGQTEFLTVTDISVTDNFYTLPYPGFDEKGLTVIDSMIIGAENSNLDSLLELPPSSFTVETTGTANPDTTHLEGLPRDQFILDNSSLSIWAEMTLPLYGTTDTLSMADTLRFVFTEFFDTPPEEIKQLIFRVSYITQFPVEVISQVYFCDENYQILEVLFNDENDPNHELRKVRGAVDEDNNGISDETPVGPIDVELSREQIDNIAGSQYIIVTGKVKTTGTDPVKFYDFYFVKTDIGVIATLELDSEDY
jgi:hypothetical protein